MEIFSSSYSIITCTLRVFLWLTHRHKNGILNIVALIGTVRNGTLSKEIIMGCDVTTAVVFCADPRFFEEHIRIIKDELRLGIKECLMIPVLGGPSVLAHPERFEAEFGYVISQIDFIANQPGSALSMIVLINHEDCRRVSLPIPESKKALREAEENILSQQGPQTTIKIDLWYARLKTSQKPENGLVLEFVKNA